MSKQIPHQNATDADDLPSPIAKCENLAQQGDFREVLKVLMREALGTLESRAVYRLLHQALDVAARADPAAFTCNAYQSMVVFNTYALLRLQQACARRLEAIEDREGGLPQWFQRDVLPQLHELQFQTAQLYNSWAATSRLWSLTQRKQARPATVNEADEPHAASSDEPKVILFQRNNDQRNDLQPPPN